MRQILMTGAALLMFTGVALAQQNNTPAPSQGSTGGYTKNGPISSSNGAAVAPNGGLQSGVGTTLVNPNTPTGGNTTPNEGGGHGSGSK